jgi:hypothetical protein
MMQIGALVIEINPGTRSTEDLVTVKQIEPVLLNKCAPTWWKPPQVRPASSTAHVTE